MDLTKMYDEAMEKRDKELEHTRMTVLELDRRKYGAMIMTDDEQFWQMLQVMEQHPYHYVGPLQAMRREAQRRSLRR